VVEENDLSGNCGELTKYEPEESYIKHTSSSLNPPERESCQKYTPSGLDGVEGMALFIGGLWYLEVVWRNIF